MHADSQLANQLLILVVVLLCLNYLFMVLIPMKSMEHEIDYTNEMISLMPKEVEEIGSG